MSSLYLIGMIQAIFLAVVILTKKRIKLSDVCLTIFILLMGLRLFSIYLSETNLDKYYQPVIIMEIIYWPLFGPFLFLYINTMISTDHKFKWIYLIHFIPAIFVYAIFSEYIALSGHLKLSEYKGEGFFFLIGKYLWYFTTHAYFIFSIIRIHIYRRKIKNYFSFRKNVDLKWLMILTYGFGTYLCTALFLILTRSYFKVELPEFTSYITWLIMVVYIFGIAFYGYKQKEIFSNVVTNSSLITAAKDFEQKEKDNHTEKDKKIPLYSKSKLSGSECEEILKNLLSFIKNDKPYLNPELDIRLLSGKLNTSPHKLSQVINTNLQKNFYEFVNEYRVEEAKVCLESPDYSKEKIMAVAYDCGFNSKSSFYSVFKKFTSQTPAEYKKEHSS